MFYLIDYHRPQGRIMTMKTFPDTDYRAAMDARLEIELDLFHNKILDREVVVLQADSLETLKINHSRYFQSLEESFEQLLAAITKG